MDNGCFHVIVLHAFFSSTALSLSLSLAASLLLGSGRCPSSGKAAMRPRRFRLKLVDFWSCYTLIFLPAALATGATQLPSEEGLAVCSIYAS